MDPNKSSLERIRQQFDSSPYPRIPLEQSPKDNIYQLYIHNLVTAFYRCDRQVIDPTNKLILDAGCGSGYKSLILAEANPKSKIIGVDISPESVHLAKQRLAYHGFNNAEFYCLSIEELSDLEYQFDYINCDETLYLMPDPAIALSAMKSVLKPDGLIRANLHSALQRSSFYRSQKVFRKMGLMDSDIGELELETVIETMQALKDNVNLKVQTWDASFLGESGKEKILTNQLLQEDKGFVIADLFAFLKSAELEFASMVNWRDWNIRELFKDPDNLPLVWEMSLPDTSIEDQLQMYELINPVHRLLDFWCGHSHQSNQIIPFEDWNESDKHSARVYLHPQLQTSRFRTDLQSCVMQCRTVNLSQHLSLVKQVVTIDSAMAICLLPLLDAPQTITTLSEYYLTIKPIHPITLQEQSLAEVLPLVQNTIVDLESLGYLMITE
ncbi:MAG: methyltransferase domain-containing protein [Pseudanabaenaceae cyanobacterium bins.39]|nr:methyltransferase domain-containing protein [Pseudanabaenaceae cyanobacterium bins.39]